MSTLDRQLYDNVRAIYDSLTARAKCLGSRHWPQYSEEYDRGTITAATASTITTSTARTGASTPPGYGWWNPNPAIWIPGMSELFTLCIDAADPGDCWHVAAAQSTTSDSVYNADVASWVAAGYIAAPADLVGKTFAIIRAGNGYFWSDRWPTQTLVGTLGDYVWQWYRGYRENYWSHDPTETSASGLRRIPMPEDTFHWVQDDVPASGPAFDNDLWYTVSGALTPYWCLAPDLFKTIRGLQVGIETICLQFVPRRDDGYDGSAYVPTFTPATLICGPGGPLAEYNWQYRASADASIYGTPTHNASGDGTLTAPVIAGTDGSVSAGSLPGGTVSVVDGRQVWSGPAGSHDAVLSPSWTRKYPREFQRFYGQDVLIREDNGSGGLWPPSSEHPGTWVHRGPSTGYCVVTDHGFIADNAIPFVEGDLARYVGDNWADAGMRDRDEVSLSRPDGYNPQDLDYDRLTQATRAADRGRHAETLVRGVVADGGSTWLQATVTGLCPYNPALEVNHWQDHELRIHFPAGDGWPAAMVSTTIRTNTADGMVFDAAGQTDHGSTRYAAAGCTFEIVTRAIGSVWLRRGGAWIKPPTTENDPRTHHPLYPDIAETPRAYPDDQWAIAPTVVTTSGRFRRGDYVGDWLYSELAAAVAQLSWTLQAPGCKNLGPTPPNAEGETPLREGEVAAVGCSPLGTSYVSAADAANVAKGYIPAMFAQQHMYGMIHGVTYDRDAALPQENWSLSVPGYGGGFWTATGHLNKNAAHFTASGIPTLMGFSISFLAHFHRVTFGGSLLPYDSTDLATHPPEGLWAAAGCGVDWRGNGTYWSDLVGTIGEGAPPAMGIGQGGYGASGVAIIKWSV